MVTKKLPPLYMPQAGLMVGGRLNGWRYFFLRVIALANRLDLWARVAAPHWPFPHEMVLVPGDHFDQLLHPSGKLVAPDVQIDALIRGAYQVARLPMPDGIDRPAWATTTRN